MAEVGLDVQRGAQVACGEESAKFEDGGFEAAFVADAEDYSGVFAGGDGGSGVGQGEAERFFAEDVFAGGGGEDLGGLLARWGCRG